MDEGRLSLGDLLKQPNRDQDPRYGPSDRLRAYCWLGYAIQRCGSQKAFAEELYGKKDDSKLVEKWLKGLHVPTRYSVGKLEEAAPGGLALYDLPLWKLLENRPMGIKEIDRLMAPFRTDPNCWWQYWSFPNDEELGRQFRFGGVTVRADLDGLFQRGDIYGFTAIVAAVRTYEVQDHERHGEACAAMYRALPALYKLPWFASQREALEACLNAIRVRVWSSALKFDVDWDVINRQTADPEFQPKRELRKREPLTYRFQQLKDPILYAEWIPGAEVKRLRLLKEAAAERRKQRRAASKTKA